MTEKIAGIYDSMGKGIAKAIKWTIKNPGKALAVVGGTYIAHSMLPDTAQFYRDLDMERKRSIMNEQTGILKSIRQNTARKDEKPKARSQRLLVPPLS